MLAVVKPSSSRSVQAHIAWLKEQESEGKIHLKWVFTTGVFAEDVIKIRQQAHDQGMVVSIGGDGTLHLVVNAIVGLSCRVAILPSGTGNDFARQFGFTCQQWRQSILSDKVVSVDLGKVNERYFINILGVGFNASVVKWVESCRTKHKLIYIWAGLLNMFNFNNVMISSSVSPPRSSLMMLFANGQYFAAGLQCAPTALYSSKSLQCLQFCTGSLSERLIMFIFMIFGQQEKLKTVIKTHGKQFEIHNQGLDIEADGEIIGQTPALIQCCPNALRLKVP